MESKYCVLVGQRLFRTGGVHTAQGVLNRGSAHCTRCAEQTLHKNKTEVMLSTDY